MNERKTETLVRETLRKLGYLSDDTIIVEEQCSENPRINKLLKSASKSGPGAGNPEFLISCNNYTDFIIVVECKADPSCHESSSRDRYADYAVDGVLLYASHLAKDYDVLAIAVSGESMAELRVSHFLHLKKTGTPENIFGETLLSFSNYYAGYINDPHKFHQDYDKLLSYSRDLNETLHAKKIKEAHRSLLISGILIALQNSAFTASFSRHKKARQLADNLVRTIADELAGSDLPQAKLDIIRQNFSFISTHATLSEDKIFFDRLIREIDEHINSFRKTYQYFDILGQFYIEFLRYANNDKGLGIVLTPPHITSLFSTLAGVNKDSVVLDNTCGTGGFLISAMKLMVDDAKGNLKKIQHIQKKQLIGIEFQDDIYALSVTNMVLHDDGKSNIHQGDCFEHIGTIRERYRPTVGLLNPPYKTKKSDIEELEYVLNNLEMLQQGGTCVAIVPISCVLTQEGKGLGLKRKILAAHTLEGVLSMPGELFHNSKVGVVTASLIVTAHKPHPDGKKTWFAYCRDDGFVKRKNRGRTDMYDKWPTIKDRWVNAFRNRETIPGFSLMQRVQAKDEWCIEAYMDTDYSTLTQADFEREVKKYVTFRILNEMDKQ